MFTGRWLTAAALFVIAVALLAGFRASRDPSSRLRAELRRVPFAGHQAVFARYLSQLPAREILDVVEEANDFCHTAAHPLGMAIFEARRDLHESFDACGNRCTGGCFHGVLTAAVKTYASAEHPRQNTDAPVTFEQVLAHGKAICERPDAQAASRKGSCVHGIGHALMLLSGFDLSKAIEGCRAFSGEHLQYYCVSGVYMERDMKYGVEDANAGTPLAPCDAEHQFPAACFRYKIIRLFPTGATVDSVSQACLGLPEHQRRGCLHGLGYAAQQFIAARPERLGHICRAGDLNDRRMCVDGAIYSLAGFGRTAAETACSGLDADLKAHCHQATSDGLYSLDKPTALYVARRDTR
jgi:hypothetical protein